MVAMTAIAGVALAAALIAAGQAPGALAASPSPTASATSRATPAASASPSATPTADPPHSPAPPAKPPAPFEQAILPKPSHDCHPSTPPVKRVTVRPWAQHALALAAAWRLSRGAGITVAVVDSGVDDSPLLRGRVRAVTFTGHGYGDCVGHGTAVAGIVAAASEQAKGLLFAGVAPAARILSVKVTNSDKTSTAALAQGIRYAALHGAKVINVSATVVGDNPILRSAVHYALGRGCVLVAAAGNDTDSGQRGPYYPASYPGVVSVGAVTRSETLAAFSDRHSRAAVTAPGDALTSTWPGGYLASHGTTDLSGTSYSAAFVSGVAALVWSRFPKLTAAGVVHRIEASADGTIGPGSGRGLVDPVQALSAILLPGGQGTPAAAQPVTIPGAPTHPPEPKTAAVAITSGALGGAFLVAVGAVVIRQGRKRRWRPGRVRFHDGGGGGDGGGGS
jgi:membrane-anchored mycosin MYCP